MLCQGLNSQDRIYDLNFDDVLDVADVEFMVTDLLGALMGDSNLDGSVDGLDFLAWNANKFQSSSAWSDGDFNCDGIVNGADFLIWNANKFNSVVPLIAVKTPNRVEADFADVLNLEPMMDSAHENTGPGPVAASTIDFESSSDRLPVPREGLSSSTAPTDHEPWFPQIGNAFG